MKEIISFQKVLIFLLIVVMIEVACFAVEESRLSQEVADGYIRKHINEKYPNITGKIHVEFTERYSYGNQFVIENVIFDTACLESNYEGVPDAWVVGLRWKQIGTGFVTIDGKVIVELEK